MWVVNQDNDSVSVFDAVTQREGRARSPSAPRRARVAVAPNGRIWVTNKQRASISMIDPTSLTVAQTLALPRASQPFGIAFAPTGGAAFVALEASGRC